VVTSLELLVYQVGLLSGKFYKSLSSRNYPEFRDLAILSVFMIIGNAFLRSLSDFVSSLLQITWRKNLTLFLNEKYFTNKNFYYLQVQTKRIFGTLPAPIKSTNQLPIYVTNQELSSNSALLDNRDSHLASNSIVLDNPDQRITQDVDSMCLSISKITPILLISPFVIGYYVYKV
jgi:ATP-binding cassette subfamily D (ALD) protein 4